MNRFQRELGISTYELHIFLPYNFRLMILIEIDKYI